MLSFAILLFCRHRPLPSLPALEAFQAFQAEKPTSAPKLRSDKDAHKATLGSGRRGISARPSSLSSGCEAFHCNDSLSVGTWGSICFASCLVDKAATVYLSSRSSTAGEPAGFFFMWGFSLYNEALCEWASMTWQRSSFCLGDRGDNKT